MLEVDQMESDSEAINKSLKTAIKHIDEKYYLRNERDFSYELYSNLKNETFPPNVEVTCETPKRRFSFSDNVFENKLIRKCFFGNNVENTNINRYPDLVIHQYSNRQAQYLAIEIKKTVTPALILKDLAKLVVYCRGSLKFKKGILIVLNPARRIIEIPNVKEILRLYEEIEIWIVTPDNEIEIFNGKKLTQ